MISINEMKLLLKNPKDASKNHWTCDCLWCGKPGHMYVHKGLKKGPKSIHFGFDCKKCGENGAVSKLLMKLGKIHLLGGREIDINKKLTWGKLSFGEEEIVDVSIDNIKLPIGFKRLSYDDGHKMTEYLKSRKFTELEFELYQPGYTDWKQKLKNYVIVPVWRDLLVKGYVARYIGKDEEKPRYLNSDHEFSKLLGGYDELSENTTTVILVEGFFDKTSVDTELGLHYADELKCLCTFGKKLSPAQVFLLKKIGIRSLIFMYDGRDAVGDMKKIAAEMTREFEVYITYTGKIDPGASNKEQLLEYLSNMKKPSAFFFDKLNFVKLK